MIKALNMYDVLSEFSHKITDLPVLEIEVCELTQAGI